MPLFWDREDTFVKVWPCILPSLIPRYNYMLYVMSSVPDCYPSYPRKLKDLDFFAVINHTQKLSFWKLFTERSFREKKTNKIQDLLLHTLCLLAFFYLKSTLKQVWTSFYVFVFIYKQCSDNTAFLIHRTSELYTHEVCNSLKKVAYFLTKAVVSVCL